MLICSLLNVALYRRLCSPISENMACRWLCYLTIGDEVFDHSTISQFIERIGRNGFADIFYGLNEELFRQGLLSEETYADSSMVEAKASSNHLSLGGMTVAEFRERAIEENGLFVLNESVVGGDGVEGQETKCYRDCRGRLPPSRVDTDARWRTQLVEADVLRVSFSG